MRAAIELARTSEVRHSHGAVVVNNGNPVGFGLNKNRNHPTVVSPSHIKTGCSEHAEAMAIRKAGSNTKGATIFVARLNNNDETRMSAPCSNCARLIVDSGIKKIYYTI